MGYRTGFISVGARARMQDTLDATKRHRTPQHRNINRTYERRVHAEQGPVVVIVPRGTAPRVEVASATARAGLFAISLARAPLVRPSER